MGERRQRLDLKPTDTRVKGRQQQEKPQELQLLYKAFERPKIFHFIVFRTGTSTCNIFAVITLKHLTKKRCLRMQSLHQFLIAVGSLFIL